MQDVIIEALVRGENSGGKGRGYFDGGEVVVELLFLVWVSFDALGVKFWALGLIFNFRFKFRFRAWTETERDSGSALRLRLGYRCGCDIKYTALAGSCVFTGNGGLDLVFGRVLGFSYSSLQRYLQCIFVPILIITSDFDDRARILDAVNHG